jgi:hypothetical protein
MWTGSGRIMKIYNSSLPLDLAFNTANGIFDSPPLLPKNLEIRH